MKKRDGVVKYLTKGRRDVPYDRLHLCDMEIVLIDYDISMTEEEFERLPIYGFHSQAPHINGLKHSNYMCRFQIDGDVRWYIGRPSSRRIMKCWKASFPPSVSYKTEAAMQIVHELSLRFPDLSGRFGTEFGSKVLTCALNSVDLETLRAWVRYKEQKENDDER